MSDTLNRILESPDELSLRLQYADEQEAIGNAKYADFVRVQCDLAMKTYSYQSRKALHDKANAMLDVNRENWVASLAFPDCIEYALWKNGMVDDVVVNLDKLDEDLSEVLSKAPITTVSFADECELDAIARFAANEGLKKVKRLDLTEAVLEEEGAKRLFASSCFESLESLIIPDEECVPEVIKYLADAAMPALRQIMFTGAMSARLGEEGLQLLLESTWLGQLTSLDLWNNRIGPDGASVIAAKATLNQLEHLSLAGGNYATNKILAEGANALANSDVFGNLVSLNLGFNEIGDAGFEAIAKSSCLTQLKTLSLQANNISRDSLVYIGIAPWLKALELLDLSHNAVCEQAVERLVLAAPESLNTLWLYNNPVMDKGARMIANAPMSSQLIELNLAQTQMTDAGALSLMGSAYLTNLRCLYLGLNDFSEDTVVKLKAHFGDALADLD